MQDERAARMDSWRAGEITSYAWALKVSEPGSDNAGSGFTCKTANPSAPL
jgi:hypothetical protein